MQSIHCSACEYKRDVYFSNRVYNFGNLEFGLPIRTNLGWCFACRNCVAVEFIPEVAQLVEELADEQQIACSREADFGLPNNHLLWAESRLHWRHERISAARCLECGSVNIRDFGGGIASSACDIVSEHPNCINSGNLLLAGGGFVNRVGWTVYDTEGVCHPDPSIDG